VANITLEKSRDIFDESQSRALLEIAPEHLDQVVRMAVDLGLKVTAIGKVGGESVRINSVEISLEKLQDIYFGTFKRVIEQDL
jgi:phosphoribosylformylglycinamidine synthase